MRQFCGGDGRARCVGAARVRVATVRRKVGPIRPGIGAARGMWRRDVRVGAVLVVGESGGRLLAIQLREPAGRDADREMGSRN